MAGTLGHKFTSGKADGADATLVRPSNWNATHAWAGGSNGQVGIRDSNQTDGWQLANLARGYLAGLTLSNNGADATNDIDIAVGSCKDNADGFPITLAAGLTKQLDAVWAVGTNAGGRASGAAIANTTYHVFAILRPDTGVVDIAYDTSATGANIAANTNVAYIAIRCIGRILREAGAIVAFSQAGDEFLRSVSVRDVNANAPGTAAVTATLSVPLGAKVTARTRLMFQSANVGRSVLVSSLDESDQAPALTVAPLSTVATQVANAENLGAIDVRTNTSAQARYRASGSDVNTNVVLVTYGWIDRRGRDD